MIIKEYQHQDCQVLKGQTYLQDVRSTLIKLDWPVSKSAKEFRAELLLKLAELGWSDRVRIDHRSNINITSVFHDIGLCIQTGNMSRFYADLLKLETLFRKKLIKGAIYVIPLRNWSAELGSNIANYERFIEELEIFETTVTVPTVVFGVEGRS